jgi:DNA-binding response OmpR family regulator
MSNTSRIYVVVVGAGPFAPYVSLALRDQGLSARFLEDPTHRDAAGQPVAVRCSGKLRGWRTRLSDAIRHAKGAPCIALVTGSDPLPVVLAALEIGASAAVSGPDLVGIQMKRLLELRQRAANDGALPHALGLVQIGGRNIRLSPVEYQLFLALSSNPGCEVSYPDLLSIANIRIQDSHEAQRLLSVRMSRLRRKLGPGAKDLIRNVFKLGYVYGLPEAPFQASA